MHGELIADLTQHISYEAHVVERTVESFKAIYFSAVQDFRFRPAPLNPHSAQVGPRSAVPAGLYIDFWRGNQCLHYSASMHLGIIPHHGQLGIPRLQTYLLEGLSDVLGVKAMLAQVPMYNSSGGTDTTKDYNGLGT